MHLPSIDASSDDFVQGVAHSNSQSTRLFLPGVGTPCLDGRLRIAGIDSSCDDVAVDPVLPDSVLVDSILPGRVRLRGLDFSSAEFSAVSERASPDGNAVSGQSRVRLPGVDSSSEELSAGHVCVCVSSSRTS